MSRQRAVVFDLETVPDLAAGRELIQAAPDAADEQVRRTLGERYARAGEDPALAFVKTPLQKIVCVGAIYAERGDRGPWMVTRSGVVHVAQRPERELVQSFIDSLSETPSPQLVGFNSSAFDLPVLRYRAFAMAIPAQAIHGGNGKDYWYRFGRDHLDICDVISGFGASTRPSLAELAAISGIPAKIGGIDGSQVEAMVAAGRLEEVAAYCDTDIFVTYFLFLRFMLVTGGLGLDGYTASLEHLHQHIADRLSKRPHLTAYLDTLGTMIAAIGQLRASPGNIPKAEIAQSE
ncbi:MAG TPA: 3'-5' exonuclease [Rhizomicrobium sp.]|nr:3'-5' exonuclease [Rhizomicrobium sp.]